jgi:hypothetical protein
MEFLIRLREWVLRARGSQAFRANLKAGIRPAERNGKATEKVARQTGKRKAG